MGEFVEGGTTEDATKFADAGVVFDFAGFGIFFCEIVAAHFLKDGDGVLAAIFLRHGAEFVDGEAFFVATETSLGEEDRAGVEEFLTEGDEKEDWAPERKGEEDDGEVEEAFEEDAPADEGGLGDGDSGVAEEEIEGVFAGVEFGFAGDEAVAGVVVSGGGEDGLVESGIFEEVGLDDRVDAEGFDA